MSLNVEIRWSLDRHIAAKLDIKVKLTMKIVIVGDVHEDWIDRDEGALKFLDPEVTLFVGEFGDGDLAITTTVAKVPGPKATILGNHDAWTVRPSQDAKDRTALARKQLKVLEDSHVGYGYKHFASSGQQIAVVGARPFSEGGSELKNKPFWRDVCGVSTMTESAERIRSTFEGQPKNLSIVVIAHNGPTGLGNGRSDLCGVDFKPREGDHGDPDLRSAISQADRNISLVAFGHMHQGLIGGGLRDMLKLEAQRDTLYLNCAIVPRAVEIPGSRERASQFTVVELEDDKVTDVKSVWVKINPAGRMSVWKSEAWLQTDTKGARRYWRAGVQNGANGYLDTTRGE